MEQKSEFIEYWNGFYRNANLTLEPSRFAQHVVQYMQNGKSVVDLGCGNGRDSLYFLSKGLKVTAIDSAAEGLQILQMSGVGKAGLDIIQDDFVNSCRIFENKYDYFYSRFTLHTITQQQESELLKRVYECLRKKGMLFIEVRGIHDDLYGKGEQVGRNTYIYDDHYRRFLVKDELEIQLKALGFSIRESREDVGFAPYGTNDPCVIRMIVEKL